MSAIAIRMCFITKRREKVHRPAVAPPLTRDGPVLAASSTSPAASASGAAMRSGAEGLAIVSFPADVRNVNHLSPIQYSPSEPHPVSIASDVYATTSISSSLSDSDQSLSPRTSAAHSELFNSNCAAEIDLSPRIESSSSRRLPPTSSLPLPDFPPVALAPPSTSYPAGPSSLTSSSSTTTSFLV